MPQSLLFGETCNLDVRYLDSALIVSKIIYPKINFIT